MCIRDSVAAARAQGNFYGIGQLIHTGLQRLPGIPVSYTHLDVYKRQV